MHAVHDHAVFLLQQPIGGHVVRHPVKQARKAPGRERAAVEHADVPVDHHLPREHIDGVALLKRQRLALMLVGDVFLLADDMRLLAPGVPGVKALHNLVHGHHLHAHAARRDERPLALAPLQHALLDQLVHSAAHCDAADVILRAQLRLRGKALPLLEHVLFNLLAQRQLELLIQRNGAFLIQPVHALLQSSSVLGRCPYLLSLRTIHDNYTPPRFKRSIRFAQEKQSSVMGQGGIRRER